MASRVIYTESDQFPDGTRYEMRAYAVPDDSRYPSGINYRFQYMDLDDTTFLRFDNYPDHPDVDQHHYHTLDGVDDDIEFKGLASHVRKVHDGMTRIRKTGSYP